MADFTSNLVMWLRLDDGTGTTASDSTGNGHTGTLQNGPLWAIGTKVGSVVLDGTIDYISVPNSSALGPAAISVALWIKADVWSSSDFLYSLVCKQDNNADANYPSFDFRKNAVRQYAASCDRCRRHGVRRPKCAGRISQFI
jgi:hypothetical protein